MGWFWADTAEASQSIYPYPLPDTSGQPPPGCPMHTAASSPMPFPPKNSSTKSSDTLCPVKERNAPIPLPSTTPSIISKLNPLNYMPSNISQARAENQTVDLPVQRTMSSIPRGDSDGNWEYPSPQQMYNAMLRKGYDDTPQDAVESMVEVHNFLNEGAWAEIVEWERRFARGLGYGWEACSRGEEGSMTGAGMVASEDDVARPRLVKFEGKPNDVTPKAKILLILAQLYPAKYGGELPFDRHDWYVQRQTRQGQPREVRYVIDYYSGPPEPTGEPVFYLDVRPAIDRPSAAIERMMRWGGDIWYRASGAKARENVSR